MTRSTDIAFFIPFLNTGGAERVAINLTTAFARRGYTIDLVLVREEGDLVEEVADGVRIVDLDAHRVAASLPSLSRYLNRTRPATLFSMMTHANLIALSAARLSRTDTRVVVSEHNMPRKDIESAKDRLMLALSGRLYAWADHVTAVSEGVAAELRTVTGLDADDVSVVYNPVVTDGLLAAAEQVPDHPWFRPNEPPVVMSAGRHVPQKGFPTLLRAFSDVAANRDVRMVLLGEGKQRSQLHALAKRLDIEDRVLFPGFVDNPFSYMSASSAFVLSSIWEGFGMVLCEAMACGCPVVSTDCPSGPAEILEDGRYGPLVPVGDKEAMASAIDTILSDPPSADLLRERASDFSVEAVVDDYEPLLLPSDYPHR